MIFSTTNLFKSVPCPEGARCALTNCIFGHDLPPTVAKPASPQPEKVTDSRPHAATASEPIEPPAKKRKVTYASLAEKPPSRADQIRQQLAASKEKVSWNDSTNIDTKAKDPPRSANTSKTLSRPISPPTVSNAKSSQVNGSQAPQSKASSAATTQPNASAKSETLNPRLIPNDPAGHAKRSLFLKHLHAEMSRLNDSCAGKVPPDLKGQLPLRAQGVITIVLDEEEKVAREQPSVYGNIIKSRIAQLKKMSVEDWIKQIRTVLPDRKPSSSASNNEKPIVTNLPLDEEHLILPRLITDQSKLHNFEYITAPPSEEQIAAAKIGVEHSKNYEECDRCAARFQVFPDRNADGELTSNGPCRYHPNRKAFPPRQKTDAQTGPVQPYYPCCMELVGQPGCTVNDSHVFKTTSPGRLAAVLPFITTPTNDTPALDRHGNVVRAVTFDCEMGYTTFGLELIRLTAVTWPEKKDLIDVLVRPLGAVIDLNSRFSGVFPEHFTNAISYEQWSSSGTPASSDKGSVLPLVPNPQAARALLLSYLSPTTPLIGHAINNDLNATRLCHPTIIDTVVLFPHPKGLPMRLGLKALSHRILGRSIQMGGASGHDSKEDAVATGDLVRWKVGEVWRGMRAGGWTKKGEGVDAVLIPPAGRAMEVVSNEKTGEKRKREDEDQTNDGVGETPASAASAS